jgi:uncharacterized protein with ParB-like and HNH nuclease domain
MKANELQIINFLQTPRVQFVIPGYQRNYNWTRAEYGEFKYKIGREGGISEFPTHHKHA